MWWGRNVAVVQWSLDALKTCKFVGNMINFPKDHPNILKIHEFFNDENSFYIIMDCLNGGELFDRIV